MKDSLSVDQITINSNSGLDPVFADQQWTGTIGTTAGNSVVDGKALTGTVGGTILTDLSFSNCSASGTWS